MDGLIVNTHSCDIEERVNTHLSSAGKVVFESKTFGVKGCIDNDTSLIVHDLHEMLLAKREGLDCYDDISEHQIISLINKYTR